MNKDTVIIEKVYNAPVSKVWKAITDKDEMKKWYFQLEAFKPEVGFKFQFRSGPKDGIQYLHLCEITEVIPEKKITYSWRYDGYPGNSFVTFALEAQGGKTLLTLTHEGIETIAPSGPDFARENFVKGWTYFVNEALKKYLEPSKNN